MQISAKMFFRFLQFVLMIGVVVCLLSQEASAGGKGKGEEDIILYNGNIVMRGDKKGGTIVMANNHPSHEEVEFDPSYFTMGGFGHMRR